MQDDSKSTKPKLLQIEVKDLHGGLLTISYDIGPLMGAHRKMIEDIISSQPKNSLDFQLEETPTTDQLPKEIKRANEMISNSLGLPAEASTKEIYSELPLTDEERLSIAREIAEEIKAGRIERDKCNEIMENKIIAAKHSLQVESLLRKYLREVIENALRVTVLGVEMKSCSTLGVLDNEVIEPWRANVHEFMDSFTEIFSFRLPGRPEGSKTEISETERQRVIKDQLQKILKQIAVLYKQGIAEPSKTQLAKALNIDRKTLLRWIKDTGLNWETLLREAYEISINQMGNGNRK